VTTPFRLGMSWTLVFCALLWLGPALESQTTAPRVLQSHITSLGSFKLPTSPMGTTYGMTYAGTGGLGTYVVAYNPGNKSLFVGGHPYEQEVAEFAIPTSLSGTPTATILQNLADPLEGKLNSINPGDPNTKVIGSAFMYGGRLILGAYAYFDGSGTQTKSHFARPASFAAKGQVVGPAQIGKDYPGWVDRSMTAIPAEWQTAFGGPALAGGGGGAINSLQSWGPAATVFDPAAITGTQPVAGTLVLGYPYGNPLADTAVGNQLWAQSDVVSGMVFVAGSRSVLFFGTHGLGAYCYGPGGTNGECYDPDNSSKGTHAYPYRSQVWAYDANDLLAVKNGGTPSYRVQPYAVWELSSAFKQVQGVGYDPSTQRLYVSEVMGDGTQPLIHVYQIAGLAAVVPPLAPTNVRLTK
jgi:hypothetical protein